MGNRAASSSASTSGKTRLRARRPDRRLLTLIRTTFSNQKTVQQSFPNNYGVAAARNKAGAGAFAIDALGYKLDPTSNTPVFESYGDTWYKLHFRE